MVEDRSSIEGGVQSEVLRPVVPTLVVVGRMRAGKGEMSQNIQRKLGFTHHTASTVLKDELSSQGMVPPYTREQLWQTGKKLRETDPLTVGKRLLKKIADEHEIAPIPGAVIEGFRYVNLAEYLIRFPKVALVWIDAPQQTRFSRAQLEETPPSWEEFLKQDLTEAETLRELEALARRSGTVIENNGTKKEFIAKALGFVHTQFNINE